MFCVALTDGLLHSCTLCHFFFFIIIIIIIIIIINNISIVATKVLLCFPIH